MGGPMTESFNFLASLINGNKIITESFRPCSGLSFNFLASLINGNAPGAGEGSGEGSGLLTS